MNTERSFVKVLLLSIVTCGIYGLINTNNMAKDVNKLAQSDGKTTAGVIKLLLLSLITCGIYSFFWYYNFGERLAYAGKELGVEVKANGTLTLLLIILGSIAFGLVPIIWIYNALQDLNNLSFAHNAKYGSEPEF